MTASYLITIILLNVDRPLSWTKILKGDGLVSAPGARSGNTVYGSNRAHLVLKVVPRTVLILFDVVRVFTYTRAITMLKELGKLRL